MNYGKTLSIMIIAANAIGLEVDMLEEAKDYVYNGKQPENYSLLYFEEAAITAHNRIAKMGEATIKKANEEARKIINQINND